MGMNITTVGYGYPPQGLPQDRGSKVQIQSASAEESLSRTFPGTTSLSGYTSNEELENKARELEKIMAIFNRKLQFVIDHKTKEVIVKVIDPTTDKVVKELPPEELQRLHRRIKEALRVLFDQTV